MKYPLISVVTVVFNNQDFIETTIQSVFGQCYPHFEYIVIDGGSSDMTVPIIKRYERKITKFVSEPDHGIYDAMNKGISMASGDVVGFLNADDIFYDNHALQYIAGHFAPEIACVYGNLVYVDRNDMNKVTRRWISREFKPGLFEKSWTPAHPTFYCRRSVYERFGKYRLDFQIAADVELMYRFIQKHLIRSKFINHYLVKMRDSGISNRGLKSTIVITKEMKKAITENGGRFNLTKYLFYKFLKIRQVLFRRSK